MNRLKFLRLEKNMNMEAVAKYLNVTIQTISNYENEKRDMTPETIVKLSNYFNVSTDYLLGKSDIRNQKNTNISNNLYLLPVYGKISAGLPNWAEECLDGYLPIDPVLMNILNPEEYYFLRVDGESMNKVIKNGSYALIKKTDFVDDGEIAVCLVNGFDATLKRFTKQGDFVFLEPMSTDESFKRQIYDKNTPIKVIGKFVGKFEINNQK